MYKSNFSTSVALFYKCWRSLLRRKWTELKMLCWQNFLLSYFSCYLSDNATRPVSHYVYIIILYTVTTSYQRILFSYLKAPTTLPHTLCPQIQGQRNSLPYPFLFSYTLLLVKIRSYKSWIEVFCMELPIIIAVSNVVRTGSPLNNFCFVRNVSFFLFSFGWHFITTW